jgi:hypothetical protein
LYQRFSGRDAPNSSVQVEGNHEQDLLELSIVSVAKETPVFFIQYQLLLIRMKFCGPKSIQTVGEAWRSLLGGYLGNQGGDLTSVESGR